MPPESAAELALQQKYEALRKKKQEAASKKREAVQAGQSKEDAVRAAAVKALQARRAAEAQPPAAAKPAAGGQAPSGLKLKLVIPKREGDAPSNDQPAQHSASVASGKKELPATAGKVPVAPTAAVPAAAAAGWQRRDHGSKASQSSTARLKADAEATRAEAQDAAGPRRPSAARRPTAIRPPLAQQQQETERDGGMAGEAFHLAENGMQDYYASGGGGESYAGQGSYGDDGSYQQYQEGGFGGEDGDVDYEDRGYEEGGYDEGGYYRGGRYEEEPGAKRRRGDYDEVAEPSVRERENCTLFVGDLPPFWASRDLEDFFSQFGAVRSARVMGSQCYGFVTLCTRQEAEALLESAQEQPLQVEGHGSLRLNWSQGSMPEWKKGPAIVRPRHVGEGPHGLESYEHPRVREARMAAQVMISQQELAAVNMAEPPPTREMVAYDDL